MPIVTGFCELLWNSSARAYTSAIWPSPGAEPAAPAAPSQTVISYQGTLTDKSGNPLNQTVTMEFALYDAETGGNRLWGPETQTVEVGDGLFHVLLGGVEEIDPTDLSGDLYLDIVVNSEKMSPRELLTSVVRAVKVKESDGSFVIDGGLDVNGGAEFGVEGSGEGGEIVLQEGSSGNEWRIDNRYGSLRAHHDGKT